MGHLVRVPLRGPSVISDPRPARPAPADPAADPVASHDASVPALRSVPATGRGPGLVLVHDAWGLHDEVGALADALAAAGYAVLAPDLADDRRPTDAEGALALAAGIDPEDAGRALAATVDALRADASVDRTRVGTIGLGMGAPLAAFLATLRPDIAAAVLAGPAPDLPEEAWARSEAAFLVLPPAEDEEAVAAAETWADRLRSFGREVVVAPAPLTPDDEPAGPGAAAVEAALPGALAFLVRHLG